MTRKCPHCGSSNVAGILRGLPVFSEELEKGIAEHRIILGGCCVTGNDPSFHCNACGRDFGKPPYTRMGERQAGNEPRELFPDVITGIWFSHGGFFRGSDLIEIITAEDGRHISTYRRSRSFSEPYTMVITDGQWKTLMDTLFKQLCIHEWKQEYHNPHVCDGTQWGLTLKLTEGRYYKIFGSNDFPPLYDDLVRAFDPFMKQMKTGQPQLHPGQA